MRVQSHLHTTKYTSLPTVPLRYCCPFTIRISAPAHNTDCGIALDQNHKQFISIRYLPKACPTLCCSELISSSFLSFMSVIIDFCGRKEHSGRVQMCGHGQSTCVAYTQAHVAVRWCVPVQWLCMRMVLTCGTGGVIWVQSGAAGELTPRDLPAPHFSPCSACG